MTNKENKRPAIFGCERFLTEKKENPTNNKVDFKGIIKQDSKDIANAVWYENGSCESRLLRFLKSRVESLSEALRSEVLRVVDDEIEKLRGKEKKIKNDYEAHLDIYPHDLEAEAGIAEQIVDIRAGIATLKSLRKRFEKEGVNK